MFCFTQIGTKNLFNMYTPHNIYYRKYQHLLNSKINRRSNPSIVSQGVSFLPLNIIISLFPIPLFSRMYYSLLKKKRILNIYETIAVQSWFMKHKQYNRHSCFILIVSKTKNLFLVSGIVNIINIIHAVHIFMK